MKKIFMVCYGGGHVKIIKNIYLELIREKEIEIVVLALTGAQKYLSELNIPYMTIEKYYNIFQDKEIKNIGEKILKELKINFEDTESKLYYGYSFKELIEKYGIEKSIRGYKEFERRIFLPINFMNKVLKYEKPDLVITTNAPRMEKAALIASKELGIKSISIEDLFGEESEINIEMEKYFESNYYRSQYGNYVCVFSDRVKEKLENKTNSKILVTGNPNFDQIIKMKNKIQKLGIDKKYYVITFLSQPYQDQGKYIEKILEILRKNRNYFVIFKFHPTEDIKNYTFIFDKYNELNNRYLLLQDRLYESIKTADLVITRNSTSGIEATLLDKKVIGEKNKAIPFEKSKIGIEFLDIEKLEETINNAKNTRKINSAYSEELASIKIKKIVFNILNEKI